MKPTSKNDCYFGGCPVCGETDGYVNVRSSHWFVCDAHRVRWCIGANLFSSWKDETEGEQQANWVEIQDFRDVTPAYSQCHEPVACNTTTCVCELPF
jgi:hypothetical protein